MNRKIKLLTLSSSIVFIYLIYITAPPKMTYLALGDKHNINYSYADFIANSLRYKDKLDYYIDTTNNDILINDLINNIKANNRLKKNLREAELLTLAIGYNDILYYKSKKEASINKKIKTNLERLIPEIKKYYHRNIYLIGENSNIDKIYQEIANKDQKIVYLDVSNIAKNNSAQLIREQEISKKLLKMLEK